MKRHTHVTTFSGGVMVVLAAIALVMMPRTAACDKFTLKDGTVIIGRVERRTESHFEVMTSFGMIELDRANVDFHTKGAPWPDGTAFGPMVADTYGASRVGIGCSGRDTGSEHFNGGFVDLDIGYGITDEMDAVVFISRGDAYASSRNRTEVGGGVKLCLAKDGPAGNGLALKITATYVSQPDWTTYRKGAYAKETWHQLIVLGGLIFSEAFGQVIPYFMIGGAAWRDLDEDRDKLHYSPAIGGGAELVIGRNWAIYCGAAIPSTHVAGIESGLGIQRRFSLRN